MGTLIEILKAFLFGVVEGITEWLPVSSTGHMIILQDFVKVNIWEDGMKLFEKVIQGGAIMAVVLLFWDKLWPFRKPVEKGESIWKPGALKMWINIVIACVPAAIIGIAFDDKIDELFYNPQAVSTALIVVGIIFIITESVFTKNNVTDVKSIYKISYKDAFIIGLFQLVAAVFPGTSRSGATIIGGLLLGLSRKVAAEFTFFLAVPVMFGASLLKAVKFIAKAPAFGGAEIAILITATLTAFIVSLFAIRFLMGYIKKKDFKVFGWYRIAVGIIIIALSLM